MKWPFVLRSRKTRTFQRTRALEKTTRDRVKLRGNDADAGVVIPGASRRTSENRFIVPARANGENDFTSHYIRNSISLTMPRVRRMICTSHQRGA
jgi:hypothetical protein